MDIVVRGRHVDVPDSFREHVASKVGKIERYDGKCHRVDVEVSKEPNPRQADHAVRVEITCHGKGPVVRAEAAAPDRLAALDVAYGRLEERLRRAADRRAEHGRRAGRRPSAPVTADPLSGTIPTSESAVDTLSARDAATTQAPPDGPLVVREKTHATAAMTLDQALYEMELVGHDFYLFQDAGTDLPSVVYRRRGYDYGVLHLAVTPHPSPR